MNAVDHWRQMILQEHAQTDRVRGPRPADHWTQHAQSFKDDPHRTGDEMVEALRADLGQDYTLIDAGAGGGRLALPLALSCRWVYAVEPSPSMCNVLRETAGEYGVENVTVVETRWEDADVEPADVVLSSHVIYVIQEIEPFVRKMSRLANRLAVVVTHQTSPMSILAGLWEEVHGEERLSLPALGEFLPVLEELGIQCSVAELEPRYPLSFDSLELARDTLSARLYVKPESAEMEQFERIIDRALTNVDGVWRVKDAPEIRPCILRWGTSGM